MKEKIFAVIVVAVSLVCLFSTLCSASVPIGDDTYADSMSYSAEIWSREEINKPQSSGVDFKQDKRSLEDEQAKEIQKFIALFMLGGVTSEVVHEAGHIIVARAENVKLDFIDDEGNLIFSPSARSKHRNISIAGFGAQGLGQELIFATDTINAFTIGYTAFYAINNIAYIIVDSISEAGYKDFIMMRENGINTDFVKALLLAHTAFTIYRLYKNPKFKILPFVNVSKDEVIAGVVYPF
jgi:hypothetical protein